ncbi:MAG: hypothetical protein AB8U25_06575 [Rickettsiales endosymbiont of Dermacentor nuttalli]
MGSTKVVALENAKLNITCNSICPSWVDIDKIVRDDIGFDADSCVVITAIGKKSPDFAQGVRQTNPKIGVADQGIVFSYATNETPVLIPAPIYVETFGTGKIIDKYLVDIIPKAIYRNS